MQANPILNLSPSIALGGRDNVNGSNNNVFSLDNRGGQMMKAFDGQVANQTRRMEGAGGAQQVGGNQQSQRIEAAFKKFNDTVLQASNTLKTALLSGTQQGGGAQQTGGAHHGGNAHQAGNTQGSGGANQAGGAGAEAALTQFSDTISQGLQQLTAGLNQIQQAGGGEQGRAQQTGGGEQANGAQQGGGAQQAGNSRGSGGLDALLKQLTDTVTGAVQLLASSLKEILKGTGGDTAQLDAIFKKVTDAVSQAKQQVQALLPETQAA